MRGYTAQKYKDLVESIDDEVLQKFMQDEKDFIAEIEDSKNRTFIDLGAGNGRVEPLLSELAKEVVAIEINQDMYIGLQEKCRDLANVTTVKDDFFKLGTFVRDNMERPVFLLLQNTLGTIENGSAEDILRLTNNMARSRNGTVILSLFRQPALGSWGLKMYQSIIQMIGKVDRDKTVIEKGVFVTDEGYASRWWTDENIEHFRQLGQVVREFSTDEYTFLELAFPEPLGI